MIRFKGFSVPLNNIVNRIPFNHSQSKEDNLTSGYMSSGAYHGVWSLVTEWGKSLTEGLRRRGLLIVILPTAISPWRSLLLFSRMLLQEQQKSQQHSNMVNMLHFIRRFCNIVGRVSLVAYSYDF